MTKILVPPLLAAAAVVLPASSAAGAEPRKPTARWVVNYDDAQCVATRNYGTAEKPLILVLKPSPTGSVMRIMMVRNGPAVEAEQRSGILRFDNQPPIAVSALIYGDSKTGQFIAAANLPMQSFAANRRATTISFRGGSFDEHLAVPGFAGIAAAFDDCLANLRQVWNVGPAGGTLVRQPARPLQPLRNLFTRSMFPTLALWAGNTGTVGVSLMIDETGKVRDCMVEETSGFAALDSTSCFVITSRAKFEPAKGADGKPTKSAYFQRIRWQIAA
jgi:TonB family protein